MDLSLKESEGGFESKTPATEIRLPGSLGGQVEVGEELAISSLPGNGDVSATRFGDKDLFFANTDVDTDTFVAPLARSVEVFQQLRSPRSPEQFRYGLTLPKGTTLRPDGQGDAEVVDSEGKRVAFVPAPFATDAQGTDVPVSMAVEGDSVLLEIAPSLAGHRLPRAPGPRTGQRGMVLERRQHLRARILGLAGDRRLRRSK